MRSRSTSLRPSLSPPQVKLAQRADGELFAIKCLNRNRLVLACQSGRLAREIRLLKMLSHPNVIRLHEVLHTPSEILMVMEYVHGGDLLEILNSRPRFTESEVRHIFCMICNGSRAKNLKNVFHLTP